MMIYPGKRPLIEQLLTEPLSQSAVGNRPSCVQRWLQRKHGAYLQDRAPETEVRSLNMGRHRKWSLVARNPLATMRGHLGRRRKGVEGLCVSSLLGVLGSHTWLIGEEDVALLLERDSTPRCQHRRAHSLSFSFCSLLADGGSEDLADPRSPGVDPQFSHFSQGKQSVALLGL